MGRRQARWISDTRGERSAGDARSSHSKTIKHSIFLIDKDFQLLKHFLKHNYCDMPVVFHDFPDTLVITCIHCIVILALFWFSANESENSMENKKNYSKKKMIQNDNKSKQKRHHEFSKHLRVAVKFGEMTFDLTSSSGKKWTMFSWITESYFRRMFLGTVMKISAKVCKPRLKQNVLVLIQPKNASQKHSFNQNF